ncbi:glycoside hydrolase family 43 protein [Lacisediminihabitans sp. H27-G8]|uniref:glycoside hydrolase family 43 protein n=1 Tax=Lacisediminihabitans sp. H27-G8 TaxID=3111909 RepID=UPI0038FC8C03
MRKPVFSGYFADPFLTRFEGKYFAYGTGDPALSTRGFEALCSPDLKIWTPIGTVFAGTDPALGDSYWAPEVAFADGQYWMYYSVGHGIAGHHLRVAVADSPFGPFDDTGVNLTPDETFAIDAHPFRDHNGDRYLFFARDVLDAPRPGTHLAVKRMITMTDVETATTAVRAPDSDWQIYERSRHMYGRVLNWHTLEGPTVVQQHGRYHLFFSGGSWEGAGYGVSVATASSALGPWTHTPSAQADILSTAITGLIGPGHNSVTHDPDGAALIAYHAWNPARTRRQMYIDRLIWANGAPVAQPGKLTHSPSHTDRSVED